MDYFQFMKKKKKEKTLVSKISIFCTLILCFFFFFFFFEMLPQGRLTTIMTLVNPGGFHNLGCRLT